MKKECYEHCNCPTCVEAKNEATGNKSASVTGLCGPHPAVQMHEGDKMILKAHQTNILQKCCECGAWHEIEIERKDNGDLIFEFKMLEGEPNFDDYEVETNIVKAT